MTTLDGARADVAAIIPAAGAGTRLGPGTPKALRLLGGEPLLVHAARRLAAAAPLSCLVVASPPGYETDVQELLAAQLPACPVIVVTGGADRQRSVASALAAVPTGSDIVLVHDAARALVPAAVVAAVVAAVRSGQDAVTPVLPVVDTVVEVGRDGEVARTLDRSALRAVQTPQGFRREVLIAAHAVADARAGNTAAGVTSVTAAAGPGDTPATDDAGLVARFGVPVHTVPGAEQALKITNAQDLRLAESLLLAGATGEPAFG